jgi:hypothetical protein
VIDLITATARDAWTTCTRCDHPRLNHCHWRRGSDCGTCSRWGCPQFTRLPRFLVARLDARADRRLHARIVTGTGPVEIVPTSKESQP